MRRRLALLAEAAGAVAAVAYLRVRDPRERGALVPPCPFKLVTRLDCPGCGSARLVHDLANGDLGAAAQDNLFLLACAPLLGYCVGRQWRPLLRGETFEVPRPLAYGLLAAAAAWTVLRNVPGWPLRPQPAARSRPR